MADLNKTILVGRLTRDPVIRYTPSNQTICDFGLASGRKYKTSGGEEREETLFIDCSIWGKGGEIFNQYMKKGKQVAIEGRLKLDQWDDKQSGQKRSKISIVVENFQFLGGGERGGQHESPPAQRVDVRRAERQPAGAEVLGDEQQFQEDEIPY